MTPRPGLTPQLVVEAAAALVDEGGAEALTLAKVAASLGVRSPSLYNHVAGLDALLDAVATHALGLYAAALTAVTIGRARAEAVRALAHATRDFARAHPGLYAAMQRTREDEPGPARDAQLQAVSIVTAVLSGFEIVDDEAIHAARFLRCVIHGFVTLELTGGFGIPVAVDESFERAVDRLVDALAGWGAGAVG